MEASVAPRPGGRAELLVLYGRRRVGRTALLTRFATGRRAIVHEATDVREPDQLRDLALTYASATSGALAYDVRTRDDALTLFAEPAERERTPIVLDEIQHLARQQPGLGSMLSRAPLRT